MRMVSALYNGIMAAITPTINAEEPANTYVDGSMMNTGNQPRGSNASKPCTMGISKAMPIPAPSKEIVNASPAMNANKCPPVKPRDFNTAYSLVRSLDVMIIVLHKTSKMIPIIRYDITLIAPMIAPDEETKPC
jgi:hypothetical protein